jgi:uncharacterized membrane protein
VLIFEVLMIAAALAVSAVLYPHLSVQVPLHWDMHLHPDGSFPRWGACLYNLGMLVLVSVLTRLLPWISPKDFQVDTFRSTYRPLMLFIFLFVYCIHAATLWAGLGHVADAGKIIGVMFCLGYIYFGNALGKIRRNFFIGVITPWTLTNQRVWYATHRFASRVWLLAGLLGLVLVSFGFNLSFTATLLVSLYGTKLYSLVLYKIMERRGEIDRGQSVEPEGTI